MELEKEIHRKRRQAWYFFNRVLLLTLKTIQGAPNVLPQFIPGLLMEGLAAPWVFEKEEACPWCGGKAGSYRAGDAACGPIAFCLGCWTLDAFEPDGKRLVQASQRYDKMMSALPPGAHITGLRLEDGVVQDVEWNTDPPDEDKYDSYYALHRGDLGIAFMEFLRLIGTEGYLESYWNIYEMCEKGGGGLQADTATVLKWCRLGAELGHHACQCELGWRLEHGQDGAPDQPQAISWFQRAAEEGSSWGKENLARLYFLGEGVEKDLTKARQLLEECAADSRGLTPFGSYVLGCLTYGGKGGPMDYERAFHLFERAALFGIDAGYFYMALMLAKGEGVQQDDEKARRFFTVCAEKDDPAAMHNLGMMWRVGRGGPKDLARALEWYEKAVAHGYAAGHLGIGFVYREERWEGRDLLRAQSEFLLAVEAGEMEGYYQLGTLYLESEPPFQNLPRAAGYARRGAELGNARCQHLIGWMHMVGQGVPVDWIRAHRWLSWAVINGDESARPGLANLEVRMTLAQLQEAREGAAS